MDCGGCVQELIGIFYTDHLIQFLEKRMNNTPNLTAVLACLLIHDIDKLAIIGAEFSGQDLEITGMNRTNQIWFHLCKVFVTPL